MLIIAGDEYPLLVLAIAYLLSDAKFFARTLNSENSA
jgi:hypothetical protein